MVELILHIEGMSCSHCLNAVRQAIGGLSGVEVESVQIGRAQLRYDPAVASAEQVIAAIEEAGYRVMVGGVA